MRPRLSTLLLVAVLGKRSNVAGQDAMSAVRRRTLEADALGRRIGSTNVVVTGGSGFVGEPIVEAARDGAVTSRRLPLRPDSTNRVPIFNSPNESASQAFPRVI